MNGVCAAWIISPHVRTVRISPHPGQVTGFTTKLPYVLLRTFRRWRRSRGDRPTSDGSVLRSHGSGIGGFLSLSEVKAEVRRNPYSVLLPFSFPDRHSAKRDGGLLLPCPRGDRPPGNVPDGILLCAGWRLRRIDVKDQIPQFPAEHRVLYQNRRARIKRGAAKINE